MSESDAQRYNSKAGVYVTSVTEGSCAEKAGMQQGDVILELGGKAVKDTTELATAKKAYKAGDSCEVKVWRSGETLTLTVVFDEEPAETAEKADEQETQPRQGWQFPFGSYGGDDNGYGYGGGNNGGYGSWWDSYFGDFFGNDSEGEDDAGTGDGGYRHFGG